MDVLLQAGALLGMLALTVSGSCALWQALRDLPNRERRLMWDVATHAWAAAGERAPGAAAAAAAGAVVPLPDLTRGRP